MRNYKPKSYISPNNKIGKYIKFNKRDKVLCDFIDYLAFYGKRDRKITVALLSSDNSPSFYVWKISIEKNEGVATFQAFGHYSYMGFSVRLFRIWEIQIGGDTVLKVDIYGKGLKVIREENLWSNILSIFKKQFWMDEIKLTRVDYTVDCAKYMFNKPNSLKTKIRWRVEKNENIEYLVFGRKGQSARFIRYYDKKKEIIDRWTAWLYPEYFGYSEIMRYELQVNSDGFDEYERYLKIEDIKSFVDFGFAIGDNVATHKAKDRDDSLYYWIEYWIRKLQRERDYQTLQKIKLLLFSPQELLCSMDWVVWCETSEVVKPLGHFLNYSS